MWRHFRSISSCKCLIMHQNYWVSTVSKVAQWPWSVMSTNLSSIWNSLLDPVSLVGWCIIYSFCINSAVALMSALQKHILRVTKILLDAGMLLRKETKVFRWWQVYLKDLWSLPHFRKTNPVSPLFNSDYSIYCLKLFIPEHCLC